MSLTAFQFRFCPGLFVHQAHLPNELQQILGALENWQEDARINGYLLARLDLDCDYEQPTGLAGIALLSDDELSKALSMLGAMLHGRAIRSTLEPQVQGQLRQVIGEQGVRNCLAQVDIIIGIWPPHWQQALPSEDLASHLLHTGLAFWLTALGPIEAGFAKRLRLRLPSMAQSSTIDIAPEQVPLAQALCMKTTKLVIPECLHLLN